MKKLAVLFAALLVAGCGEKWLSDSKIKKLLEEAVDCDSLQERNDLHYQVNESEPYSGWGKEMDASGQVRRLLRFKDGKQEGRYITWHENGQKEAERTYKHSVMNAEKLWNGKGEEVETIEESRK